MKRQRLLPVSSVIVLLAAACLPAGARTAEDERREARRTPVVRAIERAAPSVVNISTRSVRTVRRLPPGFRDLPDVFGDDVGRLFPPRKREARSLGSGVIVSSLGYVVTNAHVVQRAHEIIVTFADKKHVGAELVSVDPDTDLAVIKVDTDRTLAPIEIGTSDDLMIGETVIAVGNPFGYQHTVTTGVVSATDRTIEPRRGVRYENLIQTTAPLNPGNSGGPLLNILGELIGINTAIQAGAQGLGFAIGVDRVRAMVLELLSVRRTGRAWLGLHLDADRDGAVVKSVEAGSPAAEAGLAAGDRIVSLDGEDVTDPIDFLARVMEHDVGQALALVVARDAKRLSIRARLAEPPKPDGEKLARRLYGLQLQELTPDLAERLDLSTERGLLVTGVDEGSPAAAVGFKIGDAIIQVGRHRTDDLDALGQILVDVKKGDAVRVYVVRGWSVFRARVTARATGRAVE